MSLVSLVRVSDSKPLFSNVLQSGLTQVARRPATRRNGGLLEWSTTQRRQIRRENRPSFILQSGSVLANLKVTLGRFHQSIWKDISQQQQQQKKESYRGQVNDGGREHHTLGKCMIAASDENCKPDATMSNTHRQAPIRGQLTFSLRDGDEMQSGTSMTQEGFKQKTLMLMAVAKKSKSNVILWNANDTAKSNRRGLSSAQFHT